MRRIAKCDQASRETGNRQYKEYERGSPVDLLYSCSLTNHKEIVTLSIC